MKRVAFLSFDWDYEIVSEYYLGLQDCLGDRKDLQVVIFSSFGHYYASHRPDASTFEIFSLCNLEDYDGFLIQGNRTWPPELRQQIVDEAVKLGKPVVSINYELDGAHSVGTNNYLEEYGLVYRVLRDRNCKRPAFVNGLKTSAEALARTQGYRDACARLGIEDARFYQANWQLEAGVITAKKMLRRPNDLPDVVFCCNDDLAVGVMETFQEAGIRVPDDVMITGFDNRDINQRVTPHLTTIDRDYRTIAATALNTIEQLMNGEELAQEVFSPAKHILAESCGYHYGSDSKRLNELYTANKSLKRFYEILGHFQFAVLGNESLFSILENCEEFARELDCPNVYLSLNDRYYPFDKHADATSYGTTSHLMARKIRDAASRCNGEHMYASYETNKILPSDASFDQPIYTVCPLRHHETCEGIVVTEGVPTVMRYGFLAFFLTMLAASIEDMRKSEILQASQTS